MVTCFRRPLVALLFEEIVEESEDGFLSALTVMLGGLAVVPPVGEQESSALIRA